MQAIAKHIQENGKNLNLEKLEIKSWKFDEIRHAFIDYDARVLLLVDSFDHVTQIRPIDIVRMLDDLSARDFIHMDESAQEFARILFTQFVSQDFEFVNQYFYSTCLNVLTPHIPEC